MKEALLAIISLNDGLGLFLMLGTMCLMTIVTGITIYNSIEDYHDMKLDLATADKCYRLEDKKLLDGRVHSVVLNTCTGEIKLK